MAVIFGNDLGNCGDKEIELPSNISVTVKLDEDQVSWNGEWVEIYFQNLYWTAGAPWDYVHCNLSGVKLNKNNTQHTASCSHPLKYYPGWEQTLLDSLSTKVVESLGICDDGYIWFHHTSMCYKLTIDDLTWDEANTECRQQGGDLASVHDNKTSHFLKSLLPSPIISTAKLRVFIGGKLSNGEWSWTDGSPWDFRDWAVGQPDQASPHDNYLQMMSWYPDGGWNDGPSGLVSLDKYGYICQKKLGKNLLPPSSTTEPILASGIY